jgi:very-short-patch-repair endonuclease
LVDLRVHFRSHAEIIEFSNACFYGQRLRVATRYGGLRAADGAALRWVDVVGHVRRPSEGGAVNEREARAVTSELRRIVIEGRYAGEVGVVTPFTAHAARIRELINADSALAAVVSARNILVATAHGFQGDERDVMLLSPVLSAGISESASGFLRKERNLFNVAITRARATLVVVGDRNACLNCDVEHLQVFARYVAERETRDHTPYPDPQSGPEYPTVARPELVSPWERVFYAALWRAGIRPICQYEIENYILDFAILREDGRRLNVEIDGEHYHRRWDGEILQRDQIRNLRLIELGWDVQRFWVYQVRDELDWCIARIRDWQAAATVDA